MKKTTLISALATSLLLTSPAFAVKTYFIDQVINYPSPCTQSVLWDDTSAIKSRMDAASWSGQKYVDSDAWANDFREACSSTYGSGGLDSTYADTKAVAIFSGHGSPGTLYFGTQQNTCTLNIDQHARLGSMSGSSAAIGMYISCETLDKNGSNQPINGGMEWLQQQLGFHGLVGDNTSRYGSFFDDTSTKNNRQAWLDRLSHEPAIVVTYANGTGSCWDVANSAKMKADIFNSPRGSGPSCGAAQPLYQWCINWVN